MATQAEIDTHAQVLASVRASRDSLLEDFGETAATVTTFNSGENSLGFEINPAGEKILIKVNVDLVQQGVYALPTVSVFEFDGDTLRIPNSDIRQPIDFFFLFEGAPGGDLPFLSLVSAFPNREETVEFGVKPFPFSPEYTYEYEGLVMGDDLIPSFKSDLLANWRSASEVYAVIEVAEIGDGLPTPNVGNDVVIYSGPTPGTAADAIASQAFFGDTPPDTGGPSDTDPEFGTSEGPDNVSGAAQDDTIKGLGGNDTIKGFGGDDLIVGGGGNDKISGNAGADRLRGNAGADTLKGGGGADNIKGGGGNDVIKAGGGADVVKGGGGADRINGGGGADRLNGGGGDDLIAGKGGDDTLKGNNGADIFQFTAADRNDTILDFRQGQDQIEILSGANAFADLNITQSGADVLINFGTGSVRVVTDNARAFDEGDFIF